MNDLTKKSNWLAVKAVANPQDLDKVTADRNPFEEFAAGMMPSPFEGELLKFSKGSYIAPNDEAIDMGTTFTADVPRTVVGWQKWRDGKPVQYEMGYVRDGYRPRRRANLGDNDSSTWEVDEQGQRRDPWQLTMHLPLTQCDRNRQCSFATSSKGGIGAVAKLTGTYGYHIRELPGELPVVALGVGNYRHHNKSYGKILFPEFIVVGWTGGSALNASMPDPEDPSGSGRSMAPAADAVF